MRLAHRLSQLLLALLAAPLSVVAQDAAPAQRPEVAAAAQQLQQQVVDWRRDFHAHPELSNREERTAGKVAEHLRALGLELRTGIAHHGVTAIIRGGKRSEEHTSELQSLMRISYAVFCLKKKKQFTQQYKLQ